MGEVYCRCMFGTRSPRVGLMSMGEEEGKGNDLTREVHEVLKESRLNFVGNVEGRDLFSGKVDVMSDMTRFDAERLHQLISNHHRYTGSTRAKAILDDWANCKGKFRKVMPIEYRRALAELNAAMKEAAE